jgi:hypothetical protein
LGPPAPFVCVHLPYGSEGEDTLACVRGGGGPNSDVGTVTVVLQVYMYFVSEFIPLDYFRRTPYTFTIKIRIGLLVLY